MKTPPCLSALFSLALAGSLAAATPDSPEVLLQRALETRLIAESADGMTGEGAAWHAAFHSGQILSAYQATGDTAYLDAAIRYFDALLQATFLSPDGYRGWVGPYIYDEAHFGDVHVGDAILVNPMLEVAETVLQGPSAELRQQYAGTVRRYIAYAEEHVLEKWNARGTWWEDGRFGGYFAWDHYLDRAANRWVARPEVKNSSLGLPFNKNLDMALTHLRVHRLTGNPDHREQARKIFHHFKSRLGIFKDSYTWNYWEPVYPGDIRSIDPPEMAHWVGTHPYRNYQSGEVHAVVEAFHNGLTFDREDIRRFLATNLMMWNGRLDDPQFRNSDHAV